MLSPALWALCIWASIFCVRAQVLDNYFNGFGMFQANPGFVQIEERATAAPTALPQQGVAAIIRPGDTHTYSVESSLRSLRVSLSTCSAPLSNSTGLSMMIGGAAVTVDQGLAESDTAGNGNISITAPTNAQLLASGATYSYQLGLGASSSYYSLLDGLYLVDTDFTNALAVSLPYQNLSDWLPLVADETWYTNKSFSASSFQIFVVDASSQNQLSRSYCAMSESALLNQNNCDLSNTTRGVTSLSRAQFLVKALNSSTQYNIYMGYPSPNTTLGGVLFPDLTVTTKNSMSCQLVYNMSFCSDMAFAVPGNASAFSVEELTAFYDTMALDRFENFSKSLQQEACQGPVDLRYSVLKNCTDCSESYRAWLCATSIPRCVDYSNNATYLMPRPRGQSRNPAINEYIDPGPYKEILPCRGLCYDLVRDCPAGLEFSCPKHTYLTQSYGQMSTDGDITCSYPGAVYDEDGSPALKVSMWLVAAAVFALVL